MQAISVTNEDDNNRWCKKIPPLRFSWQQCSLFISSEGRPLMKSCSKIANFKLITQVDSDSWSDCSNISVPYKHLKNRTNGSSPKIIPRVAHDCFTPPGSSISLPSSRISWPDPPPYLQQFTRQSSLNRHYHGRPGRKKRAAASVPGNLNIRCL